MTTAEVLPEILPAEPMTLFAHWFDHAVQHRVQPNSDSMVLATLGDHGQPSARVVLCKRVVTDPGYLLFFTNYESRKAREIDARPRAAVVFHWDTLKRQVRIEGPLLRATTQESDNYFASRARDSRIGAWASKQSSPLESRARLLQEVQQAAARFGSDAQGGEVPRPANWGGYRLWVERIELWADGAYRIHDRAVWSRALQRRDDYAYDCGPWSSTRLYP